MPENVRPHLAMGVIIFILALALIALTFIPKPPVQIQAPAGGSYYIGQMALSNL
jgi:hypothetical protein